MPYLNLGVTRKLAVGTTITLAITWVFAGFFAIELTILQKLVGYWVRSISGFYALFISTVSLCQQLIS